MFSGGGFRLDGAEGDDDDSLEAYDLWDDQDDLAKVAEPLYLDQLIERECGVLVLLCVGLHWYAAGGGGGGVSSVPLLPLSLCCRSSRSLWRSTFFPRVSDQRCPGSKAVRGHVVHRLMTNAASNN